MEYTQFGRTTLRVSKISYGTWQFGGDWGRVERSQWDTGKATVQKALELGINFFDTAQHESSQKLREAERGRAYRR